MLRRLQVSLSCQGTFSGGFSSFATLEIGKNYECSSVVYKSFFYLCSIPYPSFDLEHYWRSTIRCSSQPLAPIICYNCYLLYTFVQKSFYAKPCYTINPHLAKGNLMQRNILRPLTKLVGPTSFLNFSMIA